MTDVRSDLPWYRRAGVIGAIAVIVLALGVVVGLVLAANDDGGDGVEQVDTADTTVPAPPSTTAAPPPTTAVTTTLPARDRCVAGDQLACLELSDEELDELCDGGEGSLDACQVLLANQGDGDVGDDEDDQYGDDGDDGNGRGNDNGRGNGNGRGDDEDDDD